MTTSETIQLLASEFSIEARRQARGFNLVQSGTKIASVGSGAELLNFLLDRRQEILRREERAARAISPLKAKLQAMGLKSDYGDKRNASKRGSTLSWGALRKLRKEAKAVLIKNYGDRVAVKIDPGVIVVSDPSILREVNAFVQQGNLPFATLLK